MGLTQDESGSASFGISRMRKASFLAPTLEFLMKRHRPETLGARGALVSGALPWRMDARRREHLKRELAQAERHLAEGKGHIDRQVMIIAELERDGHDTTTAKEFLATLEQAQQPHESHRQHVLSELGA